MRKELRERLVHTACMLLLMTPALIGMTAGFTLNKSYDWFHPQWFYPVLFFFVVITVLLAWVRSRRPISRIYWAVMLSQFVLVVSTEVWMALKLAQILLDK